MYAKHSLLDMDGKYGSVSVPASVELRNVDAYRTTPVSIRTRIRISFLTFTARGDLF